MLLVPPFAGISEAATDWSRFRGPNGSGVADADPLPELLGPEENVVWRVEHPPGYSSPVLSRSSVYLTSAQGTELVTSCIERDTGELRWRRASPVKLPVPPKGPNSPVSPTPVTDGENVYVFFDSFGLLSYDEKGEERWRLELGPFRTPYGMGSSPVLVDDTLVLICDQDVGSYLLCVGKDDGTVRWKTERPGTTHGFASPVVYAPEGGAPELIISGSYEVAGYSLTAGEKLWWLTGMAWQAKTLPVLHEGMLFVHSWMASPSELGIRQITTPWDEARASFDSDAEGDDDESLSKSELSALELDQLWFLFDFDQDDTLSEEE